MGSDDGTGSVKVKKLKINFQWIQILQSLPGCFSSSFVEMKIQLCLSGGGARGFAHLGAIQAIYELGFDIVRISGTSAGAMAGSFIAAGLSPEEVRDIFLKRQLFRMFSGAFNTGLLKMDGIEKLVHQYVPGDFSALKIPLVISATDILKGKTIYFDEGPVAPVVAAASSIPGLFKPVTYLSHLLVDGGVLNNLPVEPLKKHPQPVFGIHVNPVGDIDKPRSTWAVLERTFHLGVYSNTISRTGICDVLIEPNALRKFKVFDYEKGAEIYQAGYNDVMSKANDLLERYL